MTALLIRGGGQEYPASRLFVFLTISLPYNELYMLA
jgi:hypothetical protein